MLIERVLQLSEELLHKRHQEEEEAQHLESMVQSVEQNLCLMTVCLWNTSKTQRAEDCLLLQSNLSCLFVIETSSQSREQCFQNEGGASTAAGFFVVVN